MSQYYGQKMIRCLYGPSQNTVSPIKNHSSLNKTLQPETSKISTQINMPKCSIKFLHPQNYKNVQSQANSCSESNISSTLIPAKIQNSIVIQPKQNQLNESIESQHDQINISLPPKPPKIEQSISEQQYKQQKIKEVSSTLKDFMTQLTKSITQITKAQVETILNDKLKNQVPQHLINSNNQKQHPKNIVQTKFQPQQNLMVSKRLLGQRMSLEQNLTHSLGINQSNEMNFGTRNPQLKNQNMSFAKNKNLSIDQNKSNTTAEQAADFLLENIHEMLKKINKLGENKRDQRSMWIDVDFGSYPCLNEDRIHHLNRKVFKIIQDILSVSFNLHYKQGMDYQKVKAYCSENFIINLCKLSSLEKLNTKQLGLIQQNLQQQILPYLNLSYPRSEQKIMNKQLKNRIGQKDIFNENRFDIVFNSQVKLSTKKNDINSEIMMIMNYIITLPDFKILQVSEAPLKSHPSNSSMSFSFTKEFKRDSITTEDSFKRQKIEEKSLYEVFERDMETILSKVYSKQITDKLFRISEKQLQFLMSKVSYHTNTKELIKNIDRILVGDKISESQIIQQMDFQNLDERQKQKNHEEKEEQQYKEKVQSYTKFKIGRKIPSHVEPYSKENIEQGALFVKDSSVARVLMKWAEAVQEQIVDPAKSLYLRDQPFRLHNQEQTYFLSTEQKIKQLYGYFMRSSKVVREKSQILKNNARQIFLEAIRSADQIQKFRSYREFSSQNDALVGHVCTVLQKSRQNHITSYLNMLLGQIKYIEQEYEWQIEDKRINIASRPSLINMRLGDLMRCQITSKPKQIVALYQYINLLCKISPNVFELVRVKNRCDTPNKDILINIFYHKKIMIEIQLAIKNQSPFLSCSDRFSHFIYELERAFLGPINEICCIWSLYSPKAQFFMKKFNQLNIRKSQEKYYLKFLQGQAQSKASISGQKQTKQKNDLNIHSRASFGQSACSHAFQDDEKELKLPFTCFTCGVLYYNNSTPRKRCTKCKIYECCICSIKNNCEAWIEKQFPKFAIKRKRQIGKIFYAVDLQANYKQIKAMIEVEINGKLQAYSMKLSIPQSNLTSSNAPERSILQKSIDFQEISDLSELKNLTKINIDNIKSQYEIKKLERKNFKRQMFEETHVVLQKKQNLKSYCEIKEREKIMYEELLVNEIIKQILKQHYLPKRTNQIIKKSQSFMKLTLITNPPIIPIFKGEIIKNMIDSRKQILKKIEKLNLNQNGLKQIQLGDKMPNAKNVVLSMNELKTLNLKGFRNLICLELEHNNIKNIKDLTYLNQCSQLKRLLLNYNKIDSIDGLPSTLSQLQMLGLSNNQLKVIRNFPRYENMKSLDLNFNHLGELIGIQNLRNIQELKIQNNLELANSRVGVQLLKSLSNLKRLDLSCTNLRKSLMQSVDILRYSISIAAGKQRNKDLKELLKEGAARQEHREDDLYQPLLAIISLKKLEQLNASQNDLSFVPIIKGMDKLTELNLSRNNIKDTLNLQNFQKLKWLCLKENYITKIDKLDQLSQLHWLDLSHNYINSSQLHIISRLSNLHQIQLSENQLTDLHDIGSLPKLYQISFRNNKIRSLKGLQKLTALEHIDARFNKNLSDLTGLENLSMLFQLKLSGCLVKNMQPLKTTQRIRILYLQNCGLSKITEIPVLKNLQQLYLNINRIVDLEGIQHFESLKKLQIKGNYGLVLNQSSFEALKNLSYIAFTLTYKINLRFIKNVESLEAIYIHNIENANEEQNLILIQLSILNYNIQPTDLEEKKKQNIYLGSKIEEQVIDQFDDSQCLETEFKGQKDLHFRHLPKQNSKQENI